MALSLCRKYTDNQLFPNLYCTVGVHPTRCLVFNEEIGENENIIKQLREIIQDGLTDGKVIALGELGLDYDRLEYCSKEKQLIGFKAQLKLASEFNLPMFLHDRNSNND